MHEKFLFSKGFEVFSLEEYTVANPIAKRDYAETYRLSRKRDGRPFLMKVYIPAEMPVELKFNQEPRLLAYLNSSGISASLSTASWGEFHSDDGRVFPFVISDYFEHGMLSDRLLTGGAMDAPEAVGLCLDIVSSLLGMRTPKGGNFVHCDICPENIMFGRDENGDLNGLNIVRHIATYGTIVFLVLTIVLSAIELIMNIGRLFSYTSRRLHALPIFILLCILLTAFCPAFIELDSLTAEGVQTAFTNYFSTNWDYFITAELVDASGAAVATPALTCINLLFPILAVIPFVVALMPLVFRNRPAQTVTFVPKGNKPHTYAGHSTPTKAGQPGDKHALSKNKGGKVAMAGSRSPQTSRLPKR